MIHDTHRQWIVRPDNGQGGMPLMCEGEQCWQVLCCNWNTFHECAGLGTPLLANTRITRCAPYPIHMGRLCQFPDQCVLAPAGTDDQ
jgi:hypothetical protein